MYKNEAEIGKGLQELFKSGAIKREDLFVTSKLWTEHHPADQVRPGLMDSLSRLQLDYLDLYLIHWYSPCTSSNCCLCSDIAFVSLLPGKSSSHKGVLHKLCRFEYMICIVNKVACMCTCLRSAGKLDPTWHELRIAASLAAVELQGQQSDTQIAIPNSACTFNVLRTCSDLGWLGMGLK